MREKIIEEIQEKKLIAIVRGLPQAQIVPLASALIAGGISLIEVTFDQQEPTSWQGTANAIAAIGAAHPTKARVGAGTVMNLQQLRLARDAGAKFIISPHAEETIIRETRALGLVSLPGCLTPTECAQAHAWGADFIKVFPAGSLGAGYIKAIKAPLRHLRLLAVGGVNEKNIPAFLRAGAEGFGVGGNLVDKTLVAAGRFDEITALAREYVKALDA
ncbi:MAG: bifunctional 4-hydroxy-2-oxoglutarate aldolase/2-dehydro-3-deoxy-phosphogluconate aldolase [Oscillospiraceae bacterium]|nr:bifunctional 4-hydroxy-2-oxoglutarate aldolase/2-dehydro-3-deoxy-phosphogluconate aldolase [Oscillospiraceae bacterium]